MLVAGVPGCALWSYPPCVCGCLQGPLLGAMQATVKLKWGAADPDHSGAPNRRPALLTAGRESPGEAPSLPERREPVPSMSSRPLGALETTWGAVPTSEMSSTAVCHQISCGISQLFFWRVLYPGGGGWNLTLANHHCHLEMELNSYLLTLASGHVRNIFTHSPSKSCSQSSFSLHCQRKTLARTRCWWQLLWLHSKCPEIAPTSVSLLAGKCFPVYKPTPYFASFCVVFFFLCTKQFGQPKICDLDMLWRFHQDIPGCQVTVHQAPVFQVVHALKREAMQWGNGMLGRSPWRAQWRGQALRCAREACAHMQGFDVMFPPDSELLLVRDYEPTCVPALMDTVTCTL